MPVALLVEILQGILTLVPQVPEVVALTQQAITILQRGSVTPEEAAAIRAQLDGIKGEIDKTA